MPYKIEKDGDKFCVYNTESGEKKGEFESRPEAMKQMKALYAAEKSGGDDKKKSAMEDEDEDD